MPDKEITSTVKVCDHTDNSQVCEDCLHGKPHESVSVTCNHWTLCLLKNNVKVSCIPVTSASTVLTEEELSEISGRHRYNWWEFTGQEHNHQAVFQDLIPLLNETVVLKDNHTRHEWAKKFRAELDWCEPVLYRKFVEAIERITGEMEK